MAAIAAAITVARFHEWHSVIATAVFLACTVVLIFGRLDPRGRLMMSLAADFVMVDAAFGLSVTRLLIVSVSVLFLFYFVVPSWFTGSLSAGVMIGLVWHRPTSLMIHMDASIALAVEAIVLGFLALHKRQMDRERRDFLTTSGELNQSLQQVEYMAFHDVLTGLPNRRLLMERLESRLAQAGHDGQEVGVGFIDLDHFKSINDAGGHGFGDRLLRAVAVAFGEALRPGDILARQGGDEFILVMAPSPQGEPLAAHAESIRLHLAQGLSIDHQEVFTSASFGLAVFPRDGKTADELLRHADAALYRAKEAGKNRVSLYSAELEHDASAAFYLDVALHRAIQENQFRVHYQPQVDLLTGRLLGIEALVRWYPEENRVVMPQEFLPEAQKIGMADVIDDLVLEQAIQEITALPWWQQQRFISLAVNVSAARFDNVNFADMVDHMLRRYRMPPSRLEIEITESLMVRRPEHAVSQISRLREMGIGVAVDDFGVGYSSLRYLQLLPISRIKIDKAFVANVETNDAIARAIIAIAQSLKLDVVAEGVETARQVQHLLQMGCDRAQGFYYSKAVPSEQLRLRYEWESTSVR